MTARASAAPARALRSHWTTALLIFAGLAVIHTWPLASEPTVLSRNDNGDVQLNEWILAWVAHQLPVAPARLFQGNIFYPARDTLAFSEPLIVPALLVAPALWLGASPVLAMNLAMLIGFTLTGLATYALAWTWTRDRAASLVAGSLFAFNAHTLTRLAHVQALHAYGLPLALLLADRLILEPRWPGALALGACMAMLAYTSGYLAVFATVMIAVVLLARLREWILRPAAVIAQFALASVAAAALAVPLLIPYRRVAVEQDMVRPLAEVALYSATPLGYLAAPGRLHFSSWSGGLFATPIDAFFPGVIATALSLAAISYALRTGRDRRLVWMLVALAATGFVLSLGPRTPIYGWLFTIFPPMQGLRAAARFGVLFLLAIALLAAAGLSALRREHAGRRWIPAAAVAAVILVNAEALRAPFDYRRWGGIPAIYARLAAEPGPVVLAEMPFYPPQAVFENAEYVLNSTAHWRPLLNGYSGYAPKTYTDVAGLLWHFPDERAFPPLAAAGVTHVTVHPRRYRERAASTIDALARRPDFELLGVDEATGVRLYRFTPRR